ncbi:MAG: glycine-rich protein, partial [Acidimicrobiales bacterium]
MRRSVLALAALTPLAAASFAVSTASAAPVETSFEYTGAAATLQLPAGVCAIDVTLTGARGGESSGGAILGGLGAGVSGTVIVPTAALLTITVGGAGADGDSGGAGGFNGGGDGTASPGEFNY